MPTGVIKYITNQRGFIEYDGDTIPFNIGDKGLTVGNTVEFQIKNVPQKGGALLIIAEILSEDEKIDVGESEIMELTKILNSETINIERLKKGLKYIGLNLSKFDYIQKEQVTDLLELFRIAADIDPQTASKFTKVDLRLKLEKVLKGQPIIHHNTRLSNEETTEKKLVESGQVKNIHQNSKFKRHSSRPPRSSRNKKLGKVKFFDSTKGFGYIYSYDDKNECFVHASKLISPGIDEDDLVIFETTQSKRKPGEVDAIKVSKKIPVFIFNIKTEPNSYLYPLFDNHLTQGIAVKSKYKTGFALVTAHAHSSIWNISILESETIKEPKVINFSIKIITKLLQNLKTHKDTIDWLSVFLHSGNREIDLNLIYKATMDNFEGKTIIEIAESVKRLLNVSIFQPFFDEKKATLNKISFVLWNDGYLKKLPNPSSQKELNTWYSEILISLDWQSLQHVLKRLLTEQSTSELVETSYKYLISQGWSINSRKELKKVCSFLEVFKLSFPSIVLEEDNFDCKNNKFYIELYNNEFIKELSENRLKQCIEEFESDDEIARFIEKMPSDKILSFYSFFPSLSEYQDNYISGILENEFSNIDFVCFDLESDGNTISEFAWKNNSTTKSEADFKKHEDGISKLVKLLNSETLIIGQNIKEFDLSILANHGASPSSDLIWDTLEVEMLLNPERFSYGLKTQHSAKSDTELTYCLFKNQLSRIIVSKSNYTAIKDLLPSKAIKAINQISSNPNWASLDHEYFVKQSNNFYRPSPTNQNISSQTFDLLKEKIAGEGNMVIIAPEFLWNTLSHQFDLTFYSDNKLLGFSLNKQKIESTLGDEKLLKTILSRFVDSCSLKGLQPYVQHLPIAIRLKLTQEQVTLICDYIETDFGNINNRPICIKPTDIEVLKQHENQIPNLTAIVVGNELYNLTSKLQLGQDLDFATIFDRLKNEPIWLQMSGGKSFISLEQRHCIQLEITEFPEYVQNIWLEKIGKGKFKVWCNLNFTHCINDIPLKEVHYIDWIEEAFTKPNSFIIRPDARRSGYIAQQKRVNPESLYRKIYWVYQFKLFEGIRNTNRPTILIVNNEFESEKLSAYARRKGYFIPDTKASLARQVELLHTHKAPNKLLITTFRTLDKIISSNYTGPLDFIWDSFLLQEKLQMLSGIVDEKDIQITENSNYLPSIKGDLTRKEDFDTFKLFRLHKPLVDYYYKMIVDNNHDSSLYLCDTRLADFVGIEKSLEVKSKYIILWSKEKEYKTDYKEASDFFPNDISVNINFDINEAKEILRRLFLPQKDNGDFYDWYDYQHNCLNDILPGKKDLLISLPTGAGKSVLFQAPSLFRSSFTNKLSIVVSPLKALMHDQVEILWEKGLYSNVDYLSSDKSQEEIRDIYRRIVGGEITLLYITPERFRSRSFENCLLTRLGADSGLEYVIFDEAHCISQWGQEFRPDYLNAGRKVADYSKAYQMRKLLFSATISEQVFEEISLLMPGIVTVEGTEKSYNPVRDHIKMDFKHNVAEEGRLLEIANYLMSGGFNPELSRAIIFVKSRRKVDLSALLMPDSLKEVFGTDCSFAEKVGSFHAGLDAEDRKDTYEKYKSGDILILFATKAFGMGMDIPNIHYVTHHSPPSTFEDFLQEIGRAGRNEKQRLEAGFDISENPIKTICLTTNDDFAKLKDQLHKSRISWHEVKELKKVLENYIVRFKPFTPKSKIPVAVPFNLYANEKKNTSAEHNTKFRVALHWLERLERIKIGYFTITHLEFDSASLKNLTKRINNCPNKDCEKVCHAIIQLMPKKAVSGGVVQLSIASLRGISKLSFENLFIGLLKSHSAGILKLIQDVVIVPTNLRKDEIAFYYDRRVKNKYPALKTTFSFAIEILNNVKELDSKIFEGDELDSYFLNCLEENIRFKELELPWPINSKNNSPLKDKNKYIDDLKIKRLKHAFTIIRLLGKNKHESISEKVLDGNRKLITKQSVFNGYHKKEEWLNKITQIEEDCIKLLDYIGKNNIDKNLKTFSWPDIITKLGFKKHVKYFSDLLFILSILGYCRAGGLLPTGIEVYLNSIENIDETELQSLDKKIFEEFEETRKVRELKLIALEVLAGFQKSEVGKNTDEVRKKQDSFIRKYFACHSLESLLQLLQDELPPNDPLLKKWRGDAIKSEEDRLNEEQRKVYDSEINQHINVMAGPGSGKTHTLTLRVARLVHHIGINPEEILVLAYNRAVVSELKERLGRLFNDLGYGNLAKRIKIFTFHGLVKRYCLNELKDKSFDDWESILLDQLNTSPGQIMSQLEPLKHILVDEFQDINNVRISLLNKLHDLTNSFLFIIGDPNQSIYGYERIKEKGSMSPWPYYTKFNQIFKPTQFKLYDNHRSYPDILKLASQILTLPAEHQHLIPRSTRVPDENFIRNYAQIIDRTQLKVDWWGQISVLMRERVGQRPYRQIAILFRTNNEVYRGFQRIKGLNLSNIRIRIQGSLPYEFTRIRECHTVILFLKTKIGQQVPVDFKQSFRVYTTDLISQNQNWNHFYLRVIHALVLEYLEEQDENQTFDNLIDFINELTYKDDGQLYKIYEKHIDKIAVSTHETEIVLTTMHKVKGLEFDSVIIAPSYSNLAFNQFANLSAEHITNTINEEKRLAFVAYTRARYRLFVVDFERELALKNSMPYQLPVQYQRALGIAVEPEIKKLNIGWAAKAYNFNAGVNAFISNNVKSGDFLFVKKRVVANRGNPFTVHELYKEGTTKVIGTLSRDAGKLLDHQRVTGLIVNEIVVWSYEDTLRFDEENPGRNYAATWCPEAIKQGYIYLVDFAGFGMPNNE